jgi:hypothetical protein
MKLKKLVSKFAAFTWVNCWYRYVLVELSKQMDDVFDILDDLPVIGEKIRQEGEKIWLQAKEKIKVGRLYPKP